MVALRYLLTRKSGQIILKLKNRRDADDLQEALMKEEFKSMINVNIPFRRRERIQNLYFESLSENIILLTIFKIVADMSLDSAVSGITADKLSYPLLSDSARQIIEEYRDFKAREIMVVRKINRKAGIY